MSMAPSVSWPLAASASRAASMIMPAQDPKAGMPAGHPLAQRLGQLEDLGQLPDGGGLPAGDDQAVDRLQLGRAADRAGPRAGGAQGPQVLGDVALEGQDPDRRLLLQSLRPGPAHQPRPA